MMTTTEERSGEREQGKTFLVPRHAIGFSNAREFLLSILSFVDFDYSPLFQADRLSTPHVGMDTADGAMTAIRSSKRGGLYKTS